MARGVREVEWEDKPGFNTAVALLHQYLNENEILFVCLCKQGESVVRTNKRIHNWTTCVRVSEIETMHSSLQQLMDQVARAWIKKEDKTILFTVN